MDLDQIDQVEEDEHASAWETTKVIFTTRSLRSSLLVGCFMYSLVNGINAITYFSTQTFINAGVPYRG